MKKPWLEELNRGKLTYEDYLREAYPDRYHRKKIKEERGQKEDW